MTPHEPLLGGWIFLALAKQKLGEADLAARPEDIVLGNEIVDRTLHRLRQGIVGGAHSANSVSPPPSALAGGTATACSIPSTTGTGI